VNTKRPHGLDAGCEALRLSAPAKNPRIGREASVLLQPLSFCTYYGETDPADILRDIERARKEALTRRKSPLRVICRTLAFGIERCDWKVIGSLRAAEFASRMDYDTSAIVHPSTKDASKWQVSFFDALGPVSDSQHSNVEGALRQVPPKKWKLKAF